MTDASTTMMRERLAQNSPEFRRGRGEPTFESDARSESGRRPSAATCFKRRPTWSAFVASFAAILLVNWHELAQPPAWDAAMSVHPAAITLSKNGFNLAELLHLPSYAQGGPNTHGASTVTWLYAVVYWGFSGSTALFPIMHLCQFAISAAGLAATFRLAQPLLGDALAALFCAAVLSCPTLLAQTGCLYLEAPLLASTIGALAAWSSGRRGWAVILALVACSIKETGVVAAATLAAAALLEAKAWHTRVIGAFSVLAPATTAVLIEMAVVRPPGAVAYRPPQLAFFLRYHVAERMVQAPDLCCFIGLFALVGLLQIKTVWRSLRGAKEPGCAGAASPQFGLAGLAVWALLGVLAATPLVGELYVLPRYFVQVLPCLFLVLLDALRRAAGPRAAWAATALALALFAANCGGAFYRENPANDGSVAERSLEYGDLLEAQRLAIKALAKVPAETPVFYGYPEHFMTGYPEMRFVEHRPRNGHCIALEEPYRNGRLRDFPRHFHVVVDYAALGGHQIQALVVQAARSQWLVRKAADVRRGRYRVLLVELRAP
ncbi:MAG TPA: hypothetical protein VMV10_03760 [Pirellulales bacterium]|nr:hypothetical protein [Pirellulales bacterium]